MTHTLRLTAAALAASALLAVLVTAGWAQDVDMRIRQASLDTDGSTQLVVSVGGVTDEALDEGVFSVREQGELVAGVEAEPLLETTGATVNVALLVDTSGSMSGEPMEDTKAAALSFIDEVLHTGVEVAVMEFSSSIGVVEDFTDDQEALAEAIEGLEAGGATPLYDAIVFATDRLAAHDGQRNLVLFSDGGDTTSEASLDDAIAAVEATSTALTTVALETPDLDPEALDTLGQETGGRTLTVDDSGALLQAFQAVGREIASQYVLSYHGSTVESGELDIEVAIDHAGATVTDQVVVVNPRTAAEVEGDPAAGLPSADPPAGPLVAAFASPIGWWIGVGAAGLALLALFSVLFVRPVESAGVRTLRRSLRFAEAGSAPQREQAGALERAAEVAERLPFNEQKTTDLQGRLERAAWSLRASEFRVLQAAAALGALVVGSILLANLIFGLILAVIAALIPSALLGRRIEKRANAFEEQLPDVLQLLAGSLRAGHGFIQAIDTVAREASEPAASEFARVVNESRLGGSVDEALEAMAERLDSEDFRWVVIAVNIQRQVGGNLAELLETVAETIRERERLRRHVRALSAEGRLSAWILLALPFLVAGYMMMVNPEYLAVLTGSLGGLIAIVLMLTLMGLGMAWIRKIVKIEI